MGRRRGRDITYQNPPIKPNEKLKKDQDTTEAGEYGGN